MAYVPWKLFWWQLRKKNSRWGIDELGEEGVCQIIYRYSGIQFLVMERQSSRNYFLVFAERSIYYGSIICKGFLNYFFRDMFKLSRREMHLLVVKVSLATELAAAVCAMITTQVIDRKLVRKQRLVQLGCYWMSLCWVLFPFGAFFSPSASILGGAVFGVGNGIFLASDTALCVSTVPDPARAAYYLGFWGLSGLMGGVLGTVLCGGFTGLFGSVLFQSSHGYAWEGYAACFWCGAVLCMSGGTIAAYVLTNEEQESDARTKEDKAAEQVVEMQAFAPVGTS